MAESPELCSFSISSEITYSTNSTSKGEWPIELGNQPEFTLHIYHVEWFSFGLMQIMHDANAFQSTQLILNVEGWWVSLTSRDIVDEV